MSDIRVAAGPHTFAARFDWWPRAGVRFTTVLLYRERIIHERCWISLCAVNPGLPGESATSPRRRDKSSSIPPGSAKPKSCFANGVRHFASKAGAFAGNPLSPSSTASIAPARAAN